MRLELDWSRGTAFPLSIEWPWSQALRPQRISITAWTINCTITHVNFYRTVDSVAVVDILSANH